MVDDKALSRTPMWPGRNPPFWATTGNLVGTSMGEPNPSTEVPARQMISCVTVTIPLQTVPRLLW